jgi:hypothetical protein
MLHATMTGRPLAGGSEWPCVLSALISTHE